MKRFFQICAASLLLASPAAANLINFEYTVEEDSMVPGNYFYDMQFWVDRDDPDYVDTLVISNIEVNHSDDRGAPIFGRGFVVVVPDGWRAQDVTGLPNHTRIDLVDGTPWQPTEDDFSVRFLGYSSVLADMRWDYTGFFDGAASSTIFTGTPPRDNTFLTAAPSNALTDFDPVVTPSPIPLPAGFPLLLAGLGGLAILRKRRAA